MNGKANIYSNQNVLMATLTFVDGIASGPCTIYSNGYLFFKGDFANGYLEGRGREYDENGSLLFDGFFKKGQKQNITPVKEMGGKYWKELDVNGKIARISQLDDLGNYEGLCYIFNCGVISRISKWKEGKEVSLLKQFNGDIMTEYNNGLKVYEGGFLNSLELYFPRNGKGVEFGKDGKTKIFEGTYKCGKRHGRGAKYNNGLAGKRKRWIIGHTSTGFWCIQLLYLILILCKIIGFRIDPIVSVILLSLFMILWLILWKCCGKANISKRNINDIDYIAAIICRAICKMKVILNIIKQPLCSVANQF